MWPRRTRPRAKASMQSGWRVHSGRPDASHPHPRAHRCSAPRACSSVSSPPRRFADRLRVRASVHVTLMQSGCVRSRTRAASDCMHLDQCAPKLPAGTRSQVGGRSFVRASRGESRACDCDEQGGCSAAGVRLWCMAGLVCACTQLHGVGVYGSYRPREYVRPVGS